MKSFKQLREKWSELETTKDEHGHEVLTKKGEEQLQAYKDRKAEEKRLSDIAKNSHYVRRQVYGKQTSKLRLEPKPSKK